MKVMVFAVLGLAAVIGLSLYMTLGGIPSSDEVVLALRSADGRLAEADITLDDCQLSMHTETRISDDSMTRLVSVEADLRLFELQKVSGRQLRSGATQITISREPVSDRLLWQVQQVTNQVPPALIVEPTEPSILPTDRQSAGSAEGDRKGPEWMTRDLIAEVLSRPDSSVAFNLITLNDLKNEVKHEPNPDAPHFHRFAEAVLELPFPRTFTVIRAYEGEATTAGNLVAARIATPSTLQFVAQTREQALDLGRVLFEYGAENCAA